MTAPAPIDRLLQSARIQESREPNSKKHSPIEWGIMLGVIAGGSGGSAYFRATHQLAYMHKLDAGLTGLAYGVAGLVIGAAFGATVGAVVHALMTAWKRARK